VLTHYRVDGDHGNAYTRWQRMGSPQSPTGAQYGDLEAAGALATFGEPRPVEVRNGTVTVTFPLPRQGVSLLRLTW
jgi:xylan 1,4-beta-xylosidase